MGQGDVQHLFQGERGVDRGGDREQERGPIAGSALVGQRGFELAGRASISHEGHGQQDEGRD